MAVFVQQEILSQPSSHQQSPVTGTADGTNKVFTFATPVNNIFVNGAFQTPNVDYTSSTVGNTMTVTFTVAPTAGAVVYAT